MGQIPIHKGNDDGESPLHFAASHDKLEICQYLISVGTDIDKTDNRGSTPLSVAAYRSKVDMLCRCLVEGGTGINRADNDGRTPRQMAEQVDDSEDDRERKKRREVVNYLMSIEEERAEISLAFKRAHIEEQEEEEEDVNDDDEEKEG